MRGLVALAVLWTVPAHAQILEPSNLRSEIVVSGLDGPTAMEFLGPEDILVTQKNDGRVLRVVAGVIQPTAVLDLAVSNAAERGLLGLALDPDFIHDRYVFLYYTAATSVDGDDPLGNRIVRYRWDGAALIDPRTVLELPAGPGSSHNGGVIRFGPDDRLYGVIGDLTRSGNLQNNPAGGAPDDTSVILRIDRAGLGPVDNPFSGSLARYYAYGVRNSFGLAFDPVTGDLWDTENGPGSMDEVNHVAPGFNSGWTQLMGPAVRSAGSPDALWIAPGSQYSDPEFSWDRPVAPTALAFVGSRRLGCALEHRLLVGDTNCGRVRQFRLDATRTKFHFVSPELQDLVADNADVCTVEQAEIAFGAGFGIVTDIENGPDGFVYVLSYGRGMIFRIRPAVPVPDDLDGDLVPASCDCDDTSAGSWAPPVELRQLRMSRGTTELQLGWDDRAGVAGPGGTYSVISGALDELRTSSNFAGACTLATGLSVPAAVDSRPDPTPGNARYFLVRHENTCAAGTYGSAPTVPDPRDALDSTPPPECG